MKYRFPTLIAAIFCVAILGIATAISAGNTVPEHIRMENKAYDSHKRSIVTFSHKRHVEEYKAGCGECHHDEAGKPLSDLKAGVDIKGCIECHPKPGQRPKGRDALKLTKKERLNYHAEALHYNCRDCHKKFNKRTKTRKAPTTCSKCHSKKPR